MTKTSELIAAGTREQRDRLLRDALTLHLDPREGSRFWLERAKRYDFDPRDAIRSWEDTFLLGSMEAEELRDFSIFDLVPRALHDKCDEWVVVESGGTTGKPVTTVFLEEEFQDAFVKPFVDVAKKVEFPLKAPWLFAGPSGPHAVGKAARRCARALGAPEPFEVDFDPRWARRQVPGSAGAERYLDHIVDQARGLIATQRVGVLFTTPPVLLRLGELMTPAERSGIRGVHYAGLPLHRETYRRCREELFPNAVHLGGYGNSLFGLCPELPDGDASVKYSPGNARHIVQVCCDGDRARPVEPGDTGWVSCSRLDRSCLLLHLMERDTARRIPPPPLAGDLGWNWDAFADPGPGTQAENKRTGGLY